MTIYDFLAPEYPDINDVSEAEAVQIIGEAIGVKFQYNELFEEWQAKVKQLTLVVHYSNYVLDDNKDRFLSLGVSNKRGEGGGAPRDSIEQAINWFKGRMARGG